MALRAEISGVKRGKKLTFDKKTFNSRGEKNSQGRNDHRDKNTTKQKRDYSRQVIVPKDKEPTSLTNFGKIYHWCSTETGAPKGNVCDRWVCQKLSACEGLRKKKYSKQGATSDAPPLPPEASFTHPKSERGYGCTQLYQAHW